MSKHKVIVFGATGAVGSAVARTAHDLGAQIVLAVRDMNKPTPGFKSSDIEKVYADLTKPDTVLDAAKKTQCDSAFLYAAEGSTDHMKSVGQALKSAGVNFAVFLSSYTVHGDPETIPANEAIGYQHAQIEISLRDALGPNGLVAARPGPFASNIRQYVDGIKNGEVKIFVPEATAAYAAPEDIGRVCGTVLAKRAHGDEKAVYVYGGNMLTQREAAETLAKAMGKSPKIVSASEEEAYRMYMDGFGAPEAAAKDMIRVTKNHQDGKLQILGLEIRKEDLSSVEKYTGKKALTLQEFIEQNMDLFRA